MNVNKVLTRDYKKKTLGEHGKNKPNTNPIQTQYKANSNPIPERPKMNETLFATKVYENITTFRLEQNKPNTNPIRTQFIPTEGGSNPTCSELVEPISNRIPYCSTSVPDFNAGSFPAARRRHTQHKFERTVVLINLDEDKVHSL